ncbi:hypothetical protein [Streptacidiphilus sp. EB103A]|uniref:hypothetical protein n=1 Tax=Streptacidiphilus sp. EB103A TaxID=3156275 RepID=UPI003518C7EC
MSSTPRSARRPMDPATVRASATGESRQLAQAEIRTHGTLLPGAVNAWQELWEGLLLAALMSEYGAHRPEQTGGPFGISRLTPRPEELILHVDRGQLARWAHALVPMNHSNGVMTGVAGLRWSAEDKSIVLHPASGGSRIVLARTFSRDWNRAVAAAVQVGDTVPTQAPDAREKEAARTQQARTQPCATSLSDLVRRVRLLEDLIQLPFHNGHLEYEVADGQVVDCSTGRPRLTPPWVLLHAPRTLWPARASSALNDAPAAVLAFLGRYPSTTNAGRTADGAQALVTLTGLRDEPIATTAARWALQVADEVLAGPGVGYLFDEGGWTANRRRVAEDFLGESGPVDPPGTDRLLEPGRVDLTALGRLAYLPGAHLTPRWSDMLPELPGEGTQILLRLLDWTLAAATHRAPAHTGWRQVTPQAYDDLYPNQLPHARWTAALALPDGPVPLQLRVDQHRPGDDFSYAVQPGPQGVPRWVHCATPELRFGRAPSLAAAMALAENAGTEIASGARHIRSADHRLLIPRPVPADAHPQVTELVAAAAPHERVMGLFELTGGLRTLARYDNPDDPHLYYPASHGHWHLGDDGREEAASLTAVVGEDIVLAATRIGEVANTAAADSPDYRKHLAAHQVALDPFAEVYLAAADALPDTTPLAPRHLAGLTALRSCDAQALRCLDPRPAPPGEDITEIIRELPADVHAIEDFFEAWYERRKEDGTH